MTPDVDFDSEVRLRIQLSVYAWAYENYDVSLVSDAEFDRLSLQVDPKRRTGRPKVDAFFGRSFDPSTGSWIHSHPELDQIDRLYQRYYRPTDKRD